MLAIVGAGRAGSALAVALAARGYRIVAVASRDPRRAGVLAGQVGAAVVVAPVAAMRAADVTLVAVPDAEIVRVAAAVGASGAALGGRGAVHLCASRGPEALAALRGTGAAVGAVHPLQALAGERSAPLLEGSLMAVEADPPLDAVLRRLAADLGCRPVTLAPGARPVYHAAAVLAASGPLALLDAAAELLSAAGVAPAPAGEGRFPAGCPADPAEAGLIALMRGALSNAERAGVRAALTGPIARGDADTVAAHLAALGLRPEVARLYRAVGRATLRLAGEKGREGIAHLLEEGRSRPCSSHAGAPAPHPPLPEEPVPWP